MKEAIHNSLQTFIMGLFDANVQLCYVMDLTDTDYNEIRLSKYIYLLSYILHHNNTFIRVYILHVPCPCTLSSTDGIYNSDIASKGQRLYWSGSGQCSHYPHVELYLDSKTKCLVKRERLLFIGQGKIIDQKHYYYHQPFCSVPMPSLLDISYHPKCNCIKRRINNFPSSS